MSILKSGKPRKEKRLDELRSSITKGKKFIKFSMNIPRDIHKELNIQATIDGKHMKDILMDAILHYLRKNNRI